MKNKTARIAFICYEEEKEALKRLAELEGGLTLAAMLRRLIRKVAKEKDIWPIE